MAETLTTPTVTTPDPAGSDFDTPGYRYVREYLTGKGGASEDGFDGSPIAEMIDGGELAVCPVCHFVSLPGVRLYAAGLLTEGEAAGPSPCDVCALVPTTSRRVFGGCLRSQEDLDDAAVALAEERRRRARALYDFWDAGFQGAEWLCWQAMANGLAGLRERTE